MPMKLITVHLPHRYVREIQELVRKGEYPNRSECIRVAIRTLLKKELWNRKGKKKENENV